MIKRLLPFILLCLLLPDSSLARGSFVYVTNYGDGTVSQFRENPNGTLTPLNPPAVKAWPRCHGLATDSTGKYLYVLSALEFSRRNCVLSQYRIGGDGRLTPLFPLHILLPHAPYLIVIGPSGHFLYVLNHGGAITQFRITQGGTLAASHSPAGLAGTLGFSVSLDRQHSIFYASEQTRMTNMWLGSISAFRAGKNGSLRAINLALSNDGCVSLGKYAPFPPQQILLSQSRRSAYALYQGFAGDGLKVVLAQYHIQTGGRLKSMKPPLVISPGTPQEAIIDPKGRYCYVFVLPQYRDGYPVNTNKVILVCYNIGHTGVLEHSRQQIFTAPAGLFNPVFDPSGRTLNLLTQSGISTFRVKRDGSIVPLVPSRVRAGHGPLGMVCVQQ